MRSKLYSFALLFFSSSLFGLSIEEMVHETIGTNPQVKERLSNHQAIRQEVVRARAGYLPRLDLVGDIGPEHTEIEDRVETTEDMTRSDLSIVLTQNLFEGFGTREDLNEQRSRVNASAYSTLDRANQLTLDAATAYVDYLKEKELLDLTRENVEKHEEIFAKIKERTTSGLGKRSDIEQAQGRLALAYADFFAQKNNYKDTQSRFIRIYGKDVVMSELVQPTPPDIGNISYEDLLEEALKFNPALLVLRANTQAQKAVHERAKAPFYPVVDVEFKGYANENVHGIDGYDNGYSAMLKLSYNLFNGFSDEALRVKNRFLISKEQYTYEDVSRDVSEELKLAYDANTVLGEQIKYLRMHTEYTGKTAASYAEEFKLGRRTLVDLLNAEYEYNKSQQSLAKGKYDLMGAKYRILAATGKLIDAMNLDIAGKVTIYENEH
jgi:adhesin transport system outer membrane protein